MLRVNDSGDTEDKTRLCPTCRMPISIFATKCFRCGESVGRPRVADRQLSIGQLGGESDNTYAPSDSIRAALAAFRAEHQEDMASPPPDQETQQTQTQSPKLDADGLPELDEHSIGLRSAVLTSLPEGFLRPAQVHSGAPSWIKRLWFVGGVLTAILVFALGGPTLFQLVWGSRDAKQDTEVVMQRNAALDILESGGPTLDALAAAVEAKIARDTPANARILDDVRARVAMDVKGLIEAELWDMDKLTEASRIATKARELDPSPEMVKLHDTVLQEQYAYLMVPKQFSPARGGGSVTFKLNAYLDAAKDMTDPDKAETAQVGELIAKRFRLLNVTESRAVFEDTLRGRKIGYTLTGQIESML